MKNKFPLIFLPFLLAILGFGQTPVVDQSNIKGCLAGSDGHYTLAEDGSTQTFKITTSTLDLKPHVGHDVEITGVKSSVATSAGAADNSLAVTGLNMISEQCVGPAASTTAVPDNTPATTTSAPVPDTTSTAPATTSSTAPAPTSSTLPPDATPAATTSRSAEDTNEPLTSSAKMDDQEKAERLPDTASSLPLLAMLGLGMLAMGMLLTGLRSRRSRIV